MGNSIEFGTARKGKQRTSMITFDDLSRAAVASHAAGSYAGAELSPSTAKLDAAASTPAISPSPTSAASPPVPSAAECTSTQLRAALLPRTQVLHLGAAVGTLCSSLLAHAPLDPSDRNPLAKGVDESTTFPPTLAELPDSSSFWSSSNTSPSALSGRKHIAQSMGSVFLALFLTASACGVDLRSCILNKLQLNAKKYPVELCRGKSGKYTDYSHRTGITADRQSQSTVGGTNDDSTHSEVDDGGDSSSDNSNDGEEDIHNDPSIAALTQRIRAFATDRQWSRYHTPRNIALAMMGEVGELAELFQWKGDGNEGAPQGLTNFSEEDVDHVRQELADVTIYLMRLADVCGVDLAKEAMELTADGRNA